ncbi:hypothetical protein ND925_07120 [Vibrio diabolicus]|nr:MULTISPECIES: hypothetical protein [Vibrio]EGR1442770.1 hypothetical protein [Vibrio parahaemolyticus]EGR3502907.1 hypothetical protein [Vibrio parahaemolyticus]MCC9652177.1 hypothetical protein [Vibrio sp. MA64]MCS0382543.1 hypothetical protein [Vibrio diabolicus]MDA0113967.1 hypothetical protein [Vibrio sp. 2art]
MDNNKIIRFALLASVIATVTPFKSEAARVCRQKVSLPAPSAGICDVDTSNPKMGNPFAYIDPTQGCDFSFSLPGLPSFSLDGLQGALCDTIQDIGQQGIDDALGPVLDAIPDSVDLDLDNLMEGIFDDQIEMQSKFCPVYDDKGKLVSYECASDGNGGGDIIDIEDPDHGDRECYTQNGITYCKDDEGEVTEPDPEPYDPEKDPTLPICSELDSFFDSEGNLIPCRNGTSRQATYPQSEQNLPSSSRDTNQSTKPKWDVKKGW